MIKVFVRVLNRAFPTNNLAKFFFAVNRNHTGEKKLQLYKAIRQRENRQKSDPNHKLQSQKDKAFYHRCDGCNSLLQSEDKQKYGYIDNQILNRTVTGNIKLIEFSYGEKAKDSDSKALEIISNVQKQLDIKIFNPKSKKLDHLDNVQVLLKLQEKIDDYEQSQQTIKRSKKQREQLLCFRCYTLKFHNKLPDQYNISSSFQGNNQQQIMNKVFKKHKDLPVTYLYVLDILDIAGSFKRYVFNRLIDQKAQIFIVLNKLDIANEKYLNKHFIIKQIRNKMDEFISHREESEKQQLKKRLEEIKIFLTSNVSKIGLKNMEENIQKTMVKRIQLVGYPNTGKTTLLNSLTKLSKPTSKVPGTTIYITQSKYKKNLIFDMPGMHSQQNLYNLIDKPNMRSMLAWNKFFSPPIMMNQAIFFGGRVQIKDTKIILFGLGGACSSDNKWFILNYKQFWKGLPSPSELQITKYEFDLTFKEGKAKDLEIAGWGFISFRLLTSIKTEQKRKLTLYLPKKIVFRFRESALTDTKLLTVKSNIVKRFRLERVHEDKKKDQGYKSAK